MEKEKRPQRPVGPSVAWLCQPWLTTTNPSYRFPIFETSATTLCGTTGTEKMHTNQTNIDAQQNTTTKKCAFWSALTENQCQLLQLVTWKIKHMHHLAGFCLKWGNLEFFRSAAETRWVCDFSWTTIRSLQNANAKNRGISIWAVGSIQQPLQNYKHLIGFLRGSWRAFSQIRCLF